MFGFGIKVCKEGHLMDPSWKVCPICIAPIVGWLVSMDGKRAERVYTLHEGKSKIGSGLDCEVRICFDTISRHHAIITSKDGCFNVCDVNSLTGTYVNNNQISSIDIIDGDLIKLGDKEFKFKCL